MQMPSVPLDIAAEHYADADRRARAAGARDERIKLIRALQEVKNTAPFDNNVLLGIAYAIRVLQSLK